MTSEKNWDVLKNFLVCSLCEDQSLLYDSFFLSFTLLLMALKSPPLKIKNTIGLHQDCRDDVDALQPPAKVWGHRVSSGEFKSLLHLGVV